MWQYLNYMAWSETLLLGCKQIKMQLHDITITTCNHLTTRCYTHFFFLIDQSTRCDVKVRTVLHLRLVSR